MVEEAARVLRYESVVVGKCCVMGVMLVSSLTPRAILQWIRIICSGEGVCGRTGMAVLVGLGKFNIKEGCPHNLSYPQGSIQTLPEHSRRRG